MLLWEVRVDPNTWSLDKDVKFANQPVEQGLCSLIKNLVFHFDDADIWREWEAKMYRRPGSSSYDNAGKRYLASFRDMLQHCTKVTELSLSTLEPIRPPIDFSKHDNLRYLSLSKQCLSLLPAGLQHCPQLSHLALRGAHGSVRRYFPKHWLRQQIATQTRYQNIRHLYLESFNIFQMRHLISAVPLQPLYLSLSVHHQEPAAQVVPVLAGSHLTDRLQEVQISSLAIEDAHDMAEFVQDLGELLEGRGIKLFWPSADKIATNEEDTEALDDLLDMYHKHGRSWQ